jgi:hypothetical protein
MRQESGQMIVGIVWIALMCACIATSASDCAVINITLIMI